MLNRIVAAVLAISGIGMWIVFPLSKGYVSIFILLTAFLLFWVGYLVPRLKTISMGIGFFMIMTGGFATYSNWLPQVLGEVPEEVEIAAGAIESMSPEELAEMGEIIIFGRVTGGNPNDADVGKGQCPLCHTVAGTVKRDRGPNLTGADEITKRPIAARGDLRLNDPRYKNPDFVQNEAFEGSGRATNILQYIAESHVCPSCFVVSGFGVKGTNDRQSPMPKIHKAPTSLSIDEFIMVDTYLFMKDGEDPPSPGEIRTVYEKFIPVADRAKKAPKGKKEAKGPVIALATDTPVKIIQKMQCFICHQIPGVPGASFGVIGPMLIEGHNAASRIASAEYKADIKAGIASAKTPKEYVMESIMDPNAHVVRAFGLPGNSPMPKNFAERFTVGGLTKLVDHLLSLDCKAAREAGLTGPPQENADKVCGPATKAAQNTDEKSELIKTAQLQPVMD